MGEAQEDKQIYTYEEYLQIESVSEQRMEYHYGEIYALAGSTKRHNKIITKLLTFFDLLYENTTCSPYGSDIKAEITPKGKYVYPDFAISCDESDQDESETIVRNPILIAEVLSKSTESTDRADKFNSYIKLPSLQYYLLISQHEPKVEVYSRQDHDFWYYQTFRGLETSIPLPDLKTELPLSQVYRGLHFSESSEEN